MNTRPIGLGVIGMGPSNMASTLTLLRDEPDLRYRMTGICGLSEEVIERCAREFQVPFWTTDYPRWWRAMTSTSSRCSRPTRCTRNTAPRRWRPANTSSAPSRWSRDWTTPNGWSRWFGRPV